MDSAYITTPIYYVNDRPHIGHAYTTTLCDVWARAMRLRGADTYFLTGTDEHGHKVEKSAKERGMTPQALADENAAEFQNMLKVFGFSNNDFIRTTQERHVRQVQAFVTRLRDSGAIYLGEFEGWYDEGQEEYHTETRAKELGYKSPVSGRPLVRAREQNYYFKLSGFQARLEAFFAANPGFIQPQARFNEVMGRMREGLQDVPVTRTNFSWGIPFPGDEKHVIYVWIDALFNYLTALDAGSASSSASAKVHYWPAAYQVIGKEILWFHAVIWPAMLMALDLPAPRRIHAHSFWIRDGQKMSKSLGNFIDLAVIQTFTDRYGLDAWRWYMVTQGPLDATDADFRSGHFHEMYTAELVNTVGNCASRVGAMVGKYFDGVMPADVENGGAWPERCASTVSNWEKAIDDFDLVAAARGPLDLIRGVDLFINQTEPFKLAKDSQQRDRLASILAQCSQVVRVASILLTPILPSKMEECLAGFGGAISAGRVAYGGIATGARITKMALFPRIEPATESG
ncbi:MAG: methionine--tRNA ligase [Phycisphaerales bacterium]|nr:methionine--tRNA ligase [Phycisphaerales bacterium]